MTDETTRLVGDPEEADGILEEDNPSPLWLNAIFWGTFIWSIGYVAHYHFVAHRSQAAEYEAEVARYEAAHAADAGAAAKLELTDEAVAAGEKVYAANCAGCHGAALEGGVGPSLVDAEWTHGGSLEEIRDTIANGVPANGMPGWSSIIGPAQVNQVAAFVFARSQGR